MYIESVQLFRLQPKPTCEYSHPGSDVMSVVLHRKGTALRSVGGKVTPPFLKKSPPQKPCTKHVTMYIFFPKSWLFAHIDCTSLPNLLSPKEVQHWLCLQ